MPTPVLADPVVAVRAALAAQSTLTSLVAQRIYYAIPATPTYPLLVLTLVDSDEIRPDTLGARVQVDVWGSGGSNQQVIDTHAIAAVIRSVARDLKGSWSGASISNAVAGQVIPNPDTTTSRARFVVDLQVELK
jgi:Protein of unknown function (DUF3168)